MVKVNIFFLGFLAVLSSNILFSVTYKDKIIGATEPNVQLVDKHKCLIGEYLLSAPLNQQELRLFEQDFKREYPQSNCFAMVVIAVNDLKFPGDKGYIKTAKADFIDNGYVLGAKSEKQQKAVRWALFNQAKKIADRLLAVA